MRISAKTLKFFFKNEAISNFFHLGLNQLTNVIVALIATPYLFQTIGEENFGLVSLSLSSVYLFAVLVNYGYHLNGPKRIALINNDSRELGILVARIITLRVLIGMFLSFSLIIIVYVFGGFPSYGNLLIFSLVILLSEAVLPQFLLQGLDKLKWLSFANVIAKVCYLLMIILFIKGGGDSYLVNFFLGVSGLMIYSLLLLFLYKRLALPLIIPSMKELHSSLRQNYDYFISSIAGQVSIHGGLVILTNFVDDKELGYYSLAQRVAFILRLIPIFIAQAILQHASRLYAKDVKQFQAYLKKVYVMGLILNFLIGIFIFIFSEQIILVVGGDYVEKSSSILRILGFIPFLSMLNISNMVKILVSEQQRILAKSTWGTAIFMLIISIFNSYLFGSLGLAFSLLATEFFSYLFHSYLLSQYIKKTND